MRKIINSDFEVNNNSVFEFIRVLVPEAENKKIKVRTLSDDVKISLLVEIDGKKIINTYQNIEKYISDQKTVLIKTALLKIYNKNYKWGSFIGVRPTKPIRKMLNKGLSYEKIKEYLMDLYMLHEEKADFLISVVKNSNKYLNDNSINVYIGIPFCPTKCKYCSFASYKIEKKYKERYDEFLEKLNEEINIFADLLKNKKIKIESIYIGGGTPTILSENELENLLKNITEKFDLNYLKELTLEAGRIDTISKEKLEIARKYRVDRISLNPQTFNKSTLDKVNRYWDEKEFEMIYKDAKQLGFIINMDFIIGLPDEKTEDILYTISKLEEYDPDNLTFHVLALKKASDLYQKGHNQIEIDYEKITKAIEKHTQKNKFNPYYTYRQKNSISSGENTGYSKEGKESIFNIVMIEEVQSTIGIGGGAISKFVNKGNILRIVNPKDPIVYIDEFEKRINEKIKLICQENMIESI